MIIIILVQFYKLYFSTARTIKPKNVKKITYILIFISSLIVPSCSSNDNEDGCGCFDVTLEANNQNYTVYLCNEPDIERYEKLASPKQAELNEMRARREGFCK